jgi:hypothetical protein
VPGNSFGREARLGDVGVVRDRVARLGVAARRVREGTHECCNRSSEDSEDVEAMQRPHAYEHAAHDVSLVNEVVGEEAGIF